MSIRSERRDPGLLPRVRVVTNLRGRLDSNNSTQIIGVDLTGFPGCVFAADIRPVIVIAIADKTMIST